MAAERRIAEMRALLWRYVRFLLLVSVPLTVLLIACSREIVALLFQRGAFAASDTAVVSSVQAALLLQVPFFFISSFTVRIVTALRANRIMFWGTVICAVTNVIGNYVFMSWFGVVGLALSTAIVYVVSAFYLLYATTKLITFCAKEGAMNFDVGEQSRLSLWRRFGVSVAREPFSGRRRQCLRPMCCIVITSAGFQVQIMEITSSVMSAR